MTELTIIRTLNVQPDRVWRAFTTDELAAWFWPETWQTEVTLDVRVGGRWRVSSVTVGMAVSGTYVSVEPQRRLVQTWVWDGDPEETLVTIEIEVMDAGTRLSITHEQFDSAEGRDNHLEGWNDCLDRLPTHLAAIS